MDKSIAQAAAFIQAQLAGNHQIAEFSALKADEQSVVLYGIYEVLAGGHGLGNTVKSATAENQDSSLDDELSPSELDIKVPSLAQVETSLQKYLAIKEKETNGDTSSANSSSSNLSQGSEEMTLNVSGQTDLEWAIVGLSALSVYAETLKALKAQTLPLSQDLLYWDSVLYGSRENINLALYLLQITPHEAFKALKDWVDRRTPNELTTESVQQSFQETMQDAIAAAQQLVHLLKKLKNRLAKNVSSPWSVILRLYSPLNTARESAKHRRKRILQLRNSSAQTLGFFVSQGLDVAVDGQNTWTSVISSHVDQLQSGLARDMSSTDAITAQSSSFENPAEVAHKLLSIVQQTLPERLSTYSALTAQYGTPSRITRYWPAAVGLGVAAEWAAKTAFNNRDAIIEWFRTKVVDTVIAFYRNWIVAPLMKIYGTVRHDSNAQVAIMTKQSLDADMRSLERMVVAFAEATASNQVDAAAIQSAVQQGDISSVLIPYEQQIQTPFKSAIAGQLVQALLIQIQKTKVDVEVAVSGIDKLLKSQELVFGVVAALPSLLVSAWAARAVAGLFSHEDRNARGRREISQSAFKSLGRIDRLLLQLASTPAAVVDDKKSKKSHQRTLGLLLCEISLLRELGDRVLPAAYKRQWRQDLADLEDFTAGSTAGSMSVGERQRAVLARIYNVYGRSL